VRRRRRQIASSERERSNRRMGRTSKGEQQQINKIGEWKHGF